MYWENNITLPTWEIDTIHCRVWLYQVEYGTGANWANQKRQAIQPPNEPPSLLFCCKEVNLLLHEYRRNRESMLIWHSVNLLACLGHVSGPEDTCSKSGCKHTHKQTNTQTVAFPTEENTATTAKPLLKMKVWDYTPSPLGGFSTSGLDGLPSTGTEICCRYI